jgi:hypothetical protein
MVLKILTWPKCNSYVHPCGHGIQELSDDNTNLNKVLDEICNNMNISWLQTTQAQCTRTREGILKPQVSRFVNSTS